MDTSNQTRKSSQDGYYSKLNDSGLDGKSRMSRTSSGYSLSKLKMESPRNKDQGDDSTLTSPMKVRFRNGSISSPGVPTRTMSTSILDRTDSASQTSKHSSQSAWKGNPPGEFKPKIERSMSSMIGQERRRNSSLTGSVSMQALTKPAFRNKRHSYDSVSSSDSDKLLPATPPLQQRPSTIPELQDRLDNLEEL